MSTEPFAPMGRTLALAASTTSNSGALDIASGHVLVTNKSSATAFFKMSGTASPTVTDASSGYSSGTPLLAGTAAVFATNNLKYVAVVLEAGTGTVFFTPGRGL